MTKHELIQRVLKATTDNTLTPNSVHNIVEITVMKIREAVMEGDDYITIVDGHGTFVLAHFDPEGTEDEPA